MTVGINPSCVLRFLLSSSLAKLAWIYISYFFYNTDLYPALHTAFNCLIVCKHLRRMCPRLNRRKVKTPAVTVKTRKSSVTCVKCSRPLANKYVLKIHVSVVILLIGQVPTFPIYLANGILPIIFLKQIDNRKT
jgi:hypothetical protein